MPLAGKPLCVWTIQAALAARTVGRVVVSTDDQGIRTVAEAAGAEVPFLRPRYLARDSTPAVAAVVHALRWVERAEGQLPALVMMLQPTSPLRLPSDIDAAVRLLRTSAARAVVSVTEAWHHPLWTKRLTRGGFLADFICQRRRVPQRQELPQALALNGAIYLIRSRALLQRGTFFPQRTLPYVMPAERSVDIDGPLDLFMADCLLRRGKLRHTALAQGHLEA